MLRILMVSLMALGLSLGGAFAQEPQVLVPQSHEQMMLSFAPVVKKTEPAVVNIYTKRTVQVDSGISPFMNDPMFRQFFGENSAIGAMPRERVVQSLGSGVIVGAQGVVVTSYHVIKGSDQIKVVLSTGAEYDATIDKVDEKSDLAVLKIPTKESLPFLPLRDSDTLEVGDLVLAIGNPFGIGQTVTSGIVSALARAARGVGDYQFFIQTDAAINPGNSGGALVDMEGQLVGVNTAIYSTSGSSSGVGFAIPANMVKAVLEGQAVDGKTIQPWFGINVQIITPDMAESLGLDKARGVLVKEAFKDSPAEKAGLKSGDVILKVGDKEIGGPADLDFRVATSKVGEKLPLMVRRGNETLVVDLVPESSRKAAERTEVVLLQGKHPLDGTTVTDLNPALAQELKLPPETKGVLVMKGRREGGFGMRLQAGDILLQVNGVAVESVKQLQTLIAANRRDGWQISFQRGNSTMTLSVMR